MTTTKFQYVSDLHLEFGANSQHFHNKPLKVVGDILLLAGDIMYLDQRKEWFLDWCSKNYKLTLWIPGNHEYYNGELWSKTGGVYDEYVRDNVRLVNHKVVEYNNTRIIACTNWSFVRPENTLAVQDGINDYHYVLNNDYTPVSVQKTNRMNRLSTKWLNKQVNHRYAGNTVVLTHHAPSFRCRNPHFAPNNVDDAYCNTHDQLLSDQLVDVWVHGHLHYNHDQDIHGTRVVSNCVGYLRHEHTKFVKNAHFEL